MPRAFRTAHRASARLALRASVAGVALAILGACGHNVTVETGLNKDVALADQLQRRNAPTLVAAQELAPAAPTPAPVLRMRVVTRTVERAVVVQPAIARNAHRAAISRSASVPSTVAVATAAVPTAALPTTADRAADGEVYGSGGDVGGYRGDVPRSVNSAEASAPIYRQQPQAHTGRDGVFGSIAGAIIGAAASHGDRVRGGLIGAAAGGALGAIYGHSIDRTTYADAQSAYPTYRPSVGYRRAPRYRGTI